MAEPIGPGSELLCIRTCKCSGCQEGVDAGQRYVCNDLIQPSFLREILFGGCGCGQSHLFVCVFGKSHAFCPSVFVPLGDPDAVEETDEPEHIKRDLKDHTPAETIRKLAKRIKETENV